jgi:hypothetical protein
MNRLFEPPSHAFPAKMHHDVQSLGYQSQLLEVSGFP